MKWLWMGVDAKPILNKLLPDTRTLDIATPTPEYEPAEQEQEEPTPTFVPESNSVNDCNGKVLVTLWPTTSACEVNRTNKLTFHAHISYIFLAL